MLDEGNYAYFPRNYMYLRPPNRGAEWMIYYVGREAYVYAVNGAYDDETYDSLPTPIEFDPISDTKVEITGAANMIATKLVGEANAACSKG